MTPRLIVEPPMAEREAAAWTTPEERAAAAAFAPARRREFLAWRAVVRRELGRDVRIGYAATGAPQLPDGQAHISVSHCPGRVAVLLAGGRCAVDIEPAARNFERAAPRYLTPDERMLSADPAWLAVAWCAKEALYKYAGRPSLDLLRDLRLEEGERCTDGCGAVAGGRIGELAEGACRGLFRGVFRGAFRGARRGVFRGVFRNLFRGVRRGVFYGPDRGAHRRGRADGARRDGRRRICGRNDRIAAVGAGSGITSLIIPFDEKNEKRYAAAAGVAGEARCGIGSRCAAARRGRWPRRTSSGRISARWRSSISSSGESAFGGCRFAGCSVRNSHFTDVLFRGCDFAAADLRGCSWQRVAFVDCRFSGADLSGAAMRDVVFERPKAEGMSLFGSRFRGVRFEQGMLRDAAFEECRVERLEFVRCDLARAAFFGTRLGGVSLAGSEIGGIRVTAIASPELQGVRIDRAQAFDLAALLGVEIEEVP